MRALTRKSGADDKPTSMQFDGTIKGGLDVLEWSRDGDTSARFQYRPDMPEQADRQARVLLVDPYRRWEIVPVGATIHINQDGNLELELPEGYDPEDQPQLPVVPSAPKEDDPE
jgi:hypothetical protein